MDAALRFIDILRLLARHEVDFILVGGVAAILEGAPVSTFDLDVVVVTSSENRERLLGALHDLHARYLDPAGRLILPDSSKLETLRLHRLVTDFGPLDVMESIGHGLRYADLIGSTQEYQVGDLRVRVLGLEMIILSKEQSNRDKDRAVLPVLHRTLQLKRDAAGSSEEGGGPE